MGDSGEVRLEQLWDLEGIGLTVHSPTAVSVLLGKSVFVPPREWKRIYLPYKVVVKGGVSVFCGLQRAGLISGLSITKGGQLRINVWNALDEAVYLTAKTIMANVVGAQVYIKRFGQEE